MLVPVIYAILIQLYGYPDHFGKRRHRSKNFVPQQEWAKQTKVRCSASKTRTRKIPDKDWMMGLRRYFTVTPMRGSEDRRRIGFAVGCQIVGLYLLEMSLKCALDERSIEYDGDHNLEGLFLRLPTKDQDIIRNEYRRNLHSEPGPAWDFQRSADTLLSYLGEDPFTATRYFWDCVPQERDGVLFGPSLLAPLIDTALSELHGFRVSPTEDIVFEKEFQSFETSIKSLRRADSM